MYQNLLTEIERRNLTKKEVAGMIDMPVSSFYKALSGKGNFYTNQAMKLHKLFGRLPVDYLFQEA